MYMTKHIFFSFSNILLKFIVIVVVTKLTKKKTSKKTKINNLHSHFVYLISIKLLCVMNKKEKKSPAFISVYFFCSK